MAVARRNVLSSPHAQTFVDGAIALSRRPTGITPTQLNASGIVRQAPGARLRGTATEMARQLSWWDLFTWWHVAAMSWPAAVGNRAHRGPVFLPWHRLFLRRLEEAIQVVSGDPTFGLPYWDWAEDGGLPRADQLQAPIWSLIGPPRRTGSLGAVDGLRVRIFDNSEDGGLYIGPPRRIRREAAGAFGLPTREDEAATLKDGTYDAAPWGERSNSFRNKAEGFRSPTGHPYAPPVWMHNRVHMWMSGEMAPGSSPNDPAFWLNHCNVDRIWEGWMKKHGRRYLPAAGEGPPGERADDQLFSIAWPTMTPNQVLDPGGAGLDWYRYDKLP